MLKPLFINDRLITDADIEFVRSLIEKHNDKSRHFLSELLATQWQWYQRNGLLKDRACRNILAILEKQGFIQLPPLQRQQRLTNKNSICLQQNLELY